MKIEIQRVDAKHGQEINQVLQKLNLSGNCHNRDHCAYQAIQLPYQP